ncbi:MAG: DNA methyltransferase, partial [Phototrophicaceae bacterium]
MLYYQNDQIKIYNDSVLAIDSIPAGTVDLIVTSPPYNVSIDYNSHADDSTYEDYLDFSEQWMRRCYDWLKDDGRFCLNIPLDKNKGGQKSVGADFTQIARSIGFQYHATIIWTCIIQHPLFH